MESDCFVFFQVDGIIFSGLRLRKANISSVPNNYKVNLLK